MQENRAKTVQTCSYPVYVRACLSKRSRKTEIGRFSSRSSMCRRCGFLKASQLPLLDFNAVSFTALAPFTHSSQRKPRGLMGLMEK